MSTRLRSIAYVCIPALIIMVPLIAVSRLNAEGFPLLLRPIVLCAWGVGATLAADRRLFSGSWRDAVRAVGFAPAARTVLVAAVVVSVPMWLFLPLLGWLRGVTISLRPDWLSLFVGVILVNGITEEALHRGFVFGHLRRERSFTEAATLSAGLFAAQHLYLILSIGVIAGLASVLLASLLAFPMAYVFERGGKSIAGPAILHISSNAPMIILTSDSDLLGTALLPYMGVLLVSLYAIYGLGRLMTDTVPVDGKYVLRSPGVDESA